MELIRTLLLLVSVNLLYRLGCSKVVTFPMLALTIPVGEESNFGFNRSFPGITMYSLWSQAELFVLSIHLNIVFCTGLQMLQSSHYRKKHSLEIHSSF